MAHFIPPNAFLCRFAAALLFLSAESLVLGQVIWNNSGTSSWSTSTNWTPNNVPTLAAPISAKIDNGGTAFIDAFAAGTSQMRIGESASGTLIIRNGGTLASALVFADHASLNDVTLGLNTAGVGLATVTGAGSAWTQRYGMIVGSSGRGTVEVLAGAQVTTGTLGGNGLVLGRQPTGYGEITVSGQGSKWSVLANDVTVGNFGDGVLKILDGGRMDVTTFGTLRIGDSILDPLNPPSGYVLVSGKDASGNRSTLTTGGLRVSHFATLEVKAEGLVTSSSGQIGGVTGTSTASALVTGAGSKWTVSGFLKVGETSLLTNPAVLNITLGGVVESGSAEVAKTGTVTVNGSGSAWKITQALTVGTTASPAGGILQIENGGLVSAALATINRTTMNVTGPNSVFTTNVPTMGYSGMLALYDTTLNITDQARVNSNQVQVRGAFTSSTVNVSGAGTEFYNVGLGVGLIGNGNMNVLSGGRVITSDGASIGQGDTTHFFPTTGFALVNGAGSEWSIGTGLTVGGFDTGTLRITSGGKVSITTGGMFLTGQANAAGTFIVGAASGNAAEAPGIANVPYVFGGGGNATLLFNHTSTGYFFTRDTLATGTPVPIQGNTKVIHENGVTTLLGTNTYTGATTVKGGKLYVNGTLGSTAVTVESGALLGGKGSISGPVTILNGATISPGFGPETLTTGTLTFNASSMLLYELDTAGVVGGGVNDLLVVNGNLILDGILSVTEGVNFGAGTYRLINYTGTLTNNGLDISQLNPAYGFALDVAMANQVNLIVSSLAAPRQNYWDGPFTMANSIVNGGTATWDNATTNWTKSDGTANGAWNDQTAFFQGTAGIATLGDNITYAGMQFEVTGYEIRQDAGGAFSLSPTGVATIRTGDAGAGDTAAFTTTISAPIVDGPVAGGLTKEGPGTLVLTGTNTYTGGTAINAGVLQLGDGGSSGSFVGDVLDNGTLAFNRLDSFNFNGAISGNGAVVQKGAGATVLTSGANTYAGVTTVQTGVLKAGGVNAFSASSAHTVESGALLDLDNFNNVIGSLAGAGDVSLGSATLTSGGNDSSTLFSGVMSGSGGFTKAGLGTQTFTGANTYLGGTRIQAGALQIGEGGTTGSVAGNIVNDAALIFNRSNALTYAGVISGGGSVRKLGAGVLTFTADHSYSGGTTIAAGELQLGSGGATGSVTGDILNNAILTFNRSNDYTQTGIISGSGSVKKLGLGALTLLGTHLHKGDTEVLEGKLLIPSGSSIAANAVVFTGAELGLDGRVGGNVDLYGGTLTGTGIIGGNLLNVGLVSPGNSPGTLTIQGNYTQTAAGTLRIEINGWNAGQYDRLNVGGTATLAGRLVLVQGPGLTFAVGNRAEIIVTGGGVNGQFDQVANGLVTGTILEVVVRYEPTIVAVEIVQGSFARFAGSVVAANPSITPQVASILTRTGRTLDSIVLDPREGELVQLLNATLLQDLPLAMFKIAPEELSVIHELGVAAADVQASHFARRAGEIRRGIRGGTIDPAPRPMAGKSGGGTASFDVSSKGPKQVQPVTAPAPISPDEDSWTTYFYNNIQFLDLESSTRAPGYGTNTLGMTVGADRALNDHFTVGVLLSGAGSDVDWHDTGKLEAQGGQVGAYAVFSNAGWYQNTLIAAAYNEYETRRAGLGGWAEGDTTGVTFDVLLEGGHEFVRGPLRFGPVLSAHYTNVGYRSFTERGSLAPLEIQSHHSDSLRSSIGLEASYQLQTSLGLIVPQLRIGWQHEFLDQIQTTESRFASGAGDVFSAEGPEVGRDSLQFGASVAMYWTPRFSTTVAYFAHFARDDYAAHNISLTLNWAF